METQLEKIVTKIEANPLLNKKNNEYELLRVAAYCRVSTDMNDQLESYKAQVAYYTDLISKNPKWRFVGIYADEGITGTQAKKRVQFLRMIKDCDRGKIDLILTKSVARFARNTVDSLKYVRKLKAQGIGIFFEEQNLDSLKADSEMFIGFHSVLAQAESENISANVRWGIQQRMKTGTYAFRYNILGYKKGKDGQPEIVPEDAKHIQQIYQMYLDGKSIDQLKEYLESNHILTYKGSSKWSKGIILSILKNERYSGDMLLQKTYIENCITKKVKQNNGEMAKYLIINNHPAIIDKQTFKLVQMEISKRSSKRKTSNKTITELGKYSGKYALTDLLICGECGSPYRRKTWTRNGNSKRIWRCLSRVEYGTTYCKRSISLEETKLQEAIRRAINKVIENKEEILQLIMANLSYAITGEKDTLSIYAIETQIKELNQLREDTIEMRMNTEGNKKRFDDEIKNITQQILALRDQLEIEREKIKSNEQLNIELEKIRETLFDERNQILQYDETMIRRIISHIKVMAANELIIVLKGGIKIEEKV